MGVPISNVTRRVVFAPSGVGPYAFTFEILAVTDIEVYKGDNLLTLTTDYTVTINPNGTGEVTLVATAGTDNITIIGARAIERSTDFVTGGDFFANTVNTEFDSLTIFAQQNAEGIERALRAPETDPTTIDMTLPRAADRADKFLAFDASGNPVPGAVPPELTQVLAIEDEIVAVSAIDAQVVAVAGNSTNINAVAGIAGNVTTVANISSNVTSVAGNATNINTVATDLAGTNTIGTVAGAIANVNTVAGNTTNINAVAAELGAGEDVTVVAADLTGADNIGTVAGSITDVNAVGQAIANVTAVATDLLGSDTIGTVAADLSGVDNIGTVVANLTNINKVAAIDVDVSAVAAIDGDVTTVANNVTDITNFSDVYIGPSATDPATRNDSSALQAGDLYFNTADDAMKVYTGSAWVTAYITADGFVTVADAQTITGLKTFSGALATTFINKVAITAPANSATITIADGKTLTANHSLTLAGTDATTMTFPSTSATIARTDAAQTFTGAQTFSDTATATKLIPTGNVTAGNGMYLPAANTVAIGTNGTAAITVDSSQNVGIGTSSPSSLLHVSSSGSPQFRVASTAVGGGLLAITAQSTGNSLFDSSADYVFRAGPELTRLTTDGYLRLAGGGIQFNGDTAAANALDDYEEGTWTPGVAFGGASAGVTYDATTTGVYTKVGRVVTAIGRLVLTSKGSSTGNATITGLPFTVASGDANFSGVVAFSLVSAMTFADIPTGRTVGGETTAELFETTTAGVLSSITNADFANTTSLRFTITYFV